jgi:hypothetical protein
LTNITRIPKHRIPRVCFITDTVFSLCFLRSRFIKCTHFNWAPVYFPCIPELFAQKTSKISIFFCNGLVILVFYAIFLNAKFCFKFFLQFVWIRLQIFFFISRFYITIFACVSSVKSSKCTQPKYFICG